MSNERAELHVDSYPINHDGGHGDPVVKPDAEPRRGEPSVIGLAMEKECPGSYWPHSNGYSWETPPHADGECEQHRCTDTWQVTELPSDLLGLGQ